MGFTTNQWLKGDKKQDPGHGMYDAKISARNAETGWEMERGIRVKITATREKGGDYQVFYLNMAETGSIASTLLDHANYQAKLDAIVQSLSRFSDSELLIFLKLLLERRGSGPATKSAG